MLRQARESAARGLKVAVLTFDPHPAGVLGRGQPAALTMLERRSELLRRCGVDDVFVRTFDHDFASWSPSQFAQKLVKEQLLAEIVVVGENFRFGAKRAGDLAMLRALGKELGFVAQANEIAQDERGPFSSTRIRAAVLRGDLEEAEEVLGRRHAFSGAVCEGDKRGRTIGFPTANLENIPELVPANGVYAVVVDALDPRTRALGKGVMNVGVRPTVDGTGRRAVEVHLFDFAADLYGSRLRVHLVARIRDEQKFAGVDALKAQITRDAEAAPALVAAVEPAEEAFG